MPTSGKELIREKNSSAPSEKDAGASKRFALQAQELLRPDLGWLSPKAAAWFLSDAGRMPAGFISLRAEPETAVVQSSAGTIAFLLLPEGNASEGMPSEEQMNAALAAAKKLPAGAALRVAVSPWGFEGEKLFITKAGRSVDLVLGGGPGIPFGASLFPKNPSILWARTDIKGRSVVQLRLFALPPGPRRTGAAWTEGFDFAAKLIYLSEQYRPDPLMERLIGKFHP